MSNTAWGVLFVATFIAVIAIGAAFVPKCSADEVLVKTPFWFACLKGHH